MGAELVRTCGQGGTVGLGEDDEGNDDAETFLGDTIEGGEEGCRLGCGRSSGIGILLRWTVRLDGGVYAFGGSSSLIRCSPTEGLLSSITYWCSSSDSFPELTSAENNPGCETRDRNGVKGETDGMDIVNSPRLCLKRFTCSTTCRTFGTSAGEAERTVMNNMASSCRGFSITQWFNREPCMTHSK